MGGCGVGPGGDHVVMAQEAVHLGQLCGDVDHLLAEGVVEGVGRPHLWNYSVSLSSLVMVIIPAAWSVSCELLLS